MKIKKASIGLLLIVIFLAASGTPFGASENTAQYFYTINNNSFSVGDYGEEKSFTVPEVPLSFPTEITWKMKVGKRLLSPSVKPFAKILRISANGEKKEEVNISLDSEKTGTLILQPGQLCLFQLNAGKYKALFDKYGAKVEASCSYPYIRVIAEEMDAPGKFKLTATGPLKIRNWSWSLPGQTLSGSTVQASFPTGIVPISLGNDLTPEIPFLFQLNVPDVVEANPEVVSTFGYEEFTFNGLTNLSNHYHSYSQCTWNFGDATPLKEGTAVEHLYKYAGDYIVKLKIKNSYGLSIEKSWPIKVNPFNIVNDAIVEPSKGTVPLRISFAARPKIYGKPSSIQYLWDFGDGSTSQAQSGNYTYRKVGDYKITLTIKDQYHPNFNLTPWSQMVTVTPPSIALNLRASATSGVIPLKVKFEPNLRTESQLTDIEYLWDFDDDTFTNSPSPIHIFNEPGQYRVNLTVRDRQYNIETSRQITITANPPLITAQASLQPLSGDAPLQIMGDGYADVEGYPTNLKYSWYINNKLVFKGRSFQSNLTTPGNYTILLQIVDDLPGHNARASQTWQITVRQNDKDKDKNN